MTNDSHTEFLKIVPTGDLLDKIKRPFLIYVLQFALNVLHASSLDKKPNDHKHDSTLRTMLSCVDKKPWVDNFNHVVVYATNVMAAAHIDDYNTHSAGKICPKCKDNFEMLEFDALPLALEMTYKYLTKELLKLIEECK